VSSSCLFLWYSYPVSIIYTNYCTRSKVGKHDIYSSGFSLFNRM
jgi:hypothetical protein